jgi:hypothetical protein
MDYWNYEKFISETVEAMLPRGTDRNILLTMIVVMDWEYFSKDGEHDLRYRREFLVAFHRPSNYTKVLLHELKKSEDQQPPYNSAVVIFKQMSNHDSCWRSDGLRWIFKTINDAWDFFEKTGRFTTEQTRRIDPHVGWSIFGGGPRYWLISDLKLVDPSQHMSDYSVKFERKISLKEISQYMQKTE